MVVRLFLIPLAIVALAVGVMSLIGLLAGRQPSLDDALAGLRQQGGQRTFGQLLGPGSKQRYIYAKAVIDQMKQGMDEPDRIRLAESLVDTLDHYTQPAEGDIRHLMLLALGRVWQPTPEDLSRSSATPPADRPSIPSHSQTSIPAADAASGPSAVESSVASSVSAAAALPGGASVVTPSAAASRMGVASTLIRYAADDNPRTQTAAVLAMAYWAGRDEAAVFVPVLTAIAADPKAEFDVRLAAVTSLGPLADPSDSQALSTMNDLMRNTADPRQVELVWSTALSLAQLGDRSSVPTMSRLLDRESLDQMRVYDRQTDVANPQARALNEQEKLRFLINAMEGAQRLDDPMIRDAIRRLADSDPSDRVRYAAKEVVDRWDRSASDPSR